MKLPFISFLVISAIIAAVYIYTAIEVFVQRYRFRRRLQPEDECTVLLRTYNKGGWFESATVEQIDYTTGKVDVITHSRQHQTVSLTSVYPPFEDDKPQTTEK